MELRVTAPNRIDLAGGTTDIYPLYLFMDGGCTVNLAITVTSVAVFRPLASGAIRLVSQDLHDSLEYPDRALLPVDGTFGLIARAVKALPVEGGLEIVTRNQAPTGSGLGASSALLVAVVAGLANLRGDRLTREGIIDLAAGIETSAIGVPTGKQDHIAAAFGGISAIDFGYRGYYRTDCCASSESRKRLEEMLILSYTGEGRFSGMNNWEVTKGFIEDGTGVRNGLIRIRDLAKELRMALDQGRWKEIPRLVDQEWKLRRALAPGITNVRIDEIMSAAVSSGAWANKICGAGGGGCMITLSPPAKKTRVENAIFEAGGTPVPFRIDTEGMRVSMESN